jgi:hypothetical protein
VDLMLGNQNTGGSGVDALSDMEHAVGSDFADTLLGTAASNTIEGRGGVDTIDSRAGADNLLVRDIGPDNVTCGADADSVVADDPGIDTLAADCETVAFGDSIPPETTIDAGPEGDIAETSPSFTFSANEAGATFECSVDGAAFAPCTSPTEIGPLGAGTHTFDVRAKDTFGNTDATPAKRTVNLPGEDGGGGGGDGGDGGGGGDGGSGGGGSGADITPPVVTKLRVVKARFRVGRRPTALSAAKRGSAFRYRLTETAVVSIVIKKCRTKKFKRCRAVGTLVRSAKKGKNSTKFSGRLGRKALKAGRYRAVVTAVDPAGNRSRRAQATFTVVRK